MKTRFLPYFVLIITLLLSCQNNNGVDRFQLFTYPPGSSPTGGNFDYSGSIDMWEPHDQIGTTTITIEAEDKSNKSILLDKFTIQHQASTVDPCVKWDNFDTLIVYFSECHGTFCCDDSGAIHFLERMYVYDSSKVQFVLK